MNKQNSSKKILLHICCGPCATASIEKLKKEGYEVVGFYYNPNIHPSCEYKKRLSEAKKLAEKTNIQLIVPEYNPDEYFKAVKGAENDMEKRCPKCWELRLAATAKKAKEFEICYFGTTLRISPYQNQEKLLGIGKEIAKKHSIKFYETDLVCEFHHSVELSKSLELYRQKYCGCIFSKS